jgi:hypothetical protein
LEEALPRTGVRLVFDEDYTRLPGLLQAGSVVRVF